MSHGFKEAALDADNWADVERYNSCLERLLKRRRVDITVDGPLVQSKTAWKFAVLQQSLIYRVTMLASGCADAWNGGNVVCSMLAGRALLETIGLCDFIRDETSNFVEVSDIESLEKLANEQLFSTRDEGVIDGGFGHRARSILSYVDKFEKKIPGIRDHYEFVSEWCHPNGSGHLFTFGQIDRQTGSVRFSQIAPLAKGIQGHVLGCFLFLLSMEPIMDAFDEMVPRISEIDPNVGPWISDPTGFGPI